MKETFRIWPDSEGTGLRTLYEGRTFERDRMAGRTISGKDKWPPLGQAKIFGPHEAPAAEVLEVEK